METPRIGLLMHRIKKDMQKNTDQATGYSNEDHTTSIQVIRPSSPQHRHDDRLLPRDYSLEVWATAQFPLFMVLKDFHGGLATLVTD